MTSSGLELVYVPLTRWVGFMELSWRRRRRRRRRRRERERNEVNSRLLGNKGNPAMWGNKNC